MFSRVECTILRNLRLRCAHRALPSSPALLESSSGGAAAHEGREGFKATPGLTWTLPGLSEGTAVVAAQLQHRVPCWGYVFKEVPPAATGDDTGGTPGRKVVLLGDTCNSGAIAGEQPPCASCARKGEGRGARCMHVVHVLGKTSWHIPVHECMTAHLTAS